MAADASGNVYFADAGTNTIYELSTSGQLSVFASNDGGVNGLKVDARGNVVAARAAWSRSSPSAPRER